MIEHISPFVGAIFIMYSLFAVLVLLNLVTGVFVDGAMRLSRADKEIELLEKAYKLFRSTDDDDSGDITWSEFRSRLRSPEMSSFFEALEISVTRADDLFHIIDSSQDTRDEAGFAESAGGASERHAVSPPSCARMERPGQCGWASRSGPLLGRRRSCASHGAARLRCAACARLSPPSPHVWLAFLRLPCVRSQSGNGLALTSGESQAWSRSFDELGC